MSVPSRRWALWLLAVVLVFGMSAGVLMTWHHDSQLYGGEQVELIGCKESATVNCDVVNTSAYSEVLGVPIALVAVAFYGTVLLLVGLSLRGRRGARFGVVVAGVMAVATSGFLLWVSVTQLGFVCAWCLRVYLVNVAILVLGLVGGRPARPDGRLVGTAFGFGVVLLLVLTGGERLWRSSLVGGDAPKLADAVESGRDPVGPAPTRETTVNTEDKGTATLRIEADDAWRGNPDADVAVVMFGDLECGFCKRSSAEVARLEATYGDRVLFVFKHFPMDPRCNPGVKNVKHRDACHAAKASVCAQHQGVFWAFHDLACKNQHQLGDDYLREYALAAGADGAAFDACMTSKDAQEQVIADGRQGKELGIRGTPRIWIGDKLYRSGSSAQVMAKAIELALGATTFEIDTFEASLVDGHAVSGLHRVPALGQSWFDAKAACEAAGRRLCTEREWVSACQGAEAVDVNGDGAYADDMIEGFAHPCGDFHEKGRCWDDKEGDAFRPVYTGETPGCVSAQGVYDLTGNVEEWVGDSPETAVLLGGAWDTSDDHARCYRRNDTFGAGYASPRTGLRCCSGG